MVMQLRYKPGGPSGVEVGGRTAEEIKPGGGLVNYKEI